MLNSYELKELLNAPVQMLDRLDYTENGAVAIRRISMNEPVFCGHFPGTPVLPGVLQVAAMAQAAKVCWLKEKGGVQPYLASLSRVKFRTPVTPGMTLRIECVITETAADTMSFQVKNYVGDALASSGNLVLGVRPADWFAPLDADDTQVADAELVSAIEMQKSIPHRFPFMLVDGAYGYGAVNPETKLVEIRGFRNICSNDPMVGICYPGYCQVESAAQLGCLALLSQPENKDKLGFFMSIDEAHFYHAVTPGDRIDIIDSIEVRGTFGIGKCTIQVGKIIVATADMKFAIVNR